MPSTIRVDFHCHSSCSDGAMPPEGVAQALDAAGVRFAALTDHDTLDGLPAFRSALAHRGIGFVTGVELSCMHLGKELHLLGYGFHPSAGFRRALTRTDGSGSTGHGGARSPTPPLHRALGAIVRGLSEERMLQPVGQAISRIHAAGGLCFLAHPLAPEGDLDHLKELLPDLQALGLDGLEAIYRPYPREVRARLARLAGRHDLLVIAGSDFHGDGRTGARTPGCDLPLWHWERMCSALSLVDGGEGGKETE